MKIIAIEKELPGALSSHFRELASAEALALHELWMKGIVREPYFRDDRKEAILMMEAESVELASKQLQALPYVAEGLIQFELIPLRAYPGFSRLFPSAEPDGPAH